MVRIDYFSNDAIKSDLKASIVRGGVWTAAAQMVSIVVVLGSQPALGRLLDVEDFGLVAMVVVLTNFGMLFVNAGLPMATVQRDEITPQQVTNLFWIATGLGTLIGLIVAALAPAISWFYSEPRLTPITLSLAASFVLNGMTIQHRALLRRTLQFRQAAYIQIAAIVLAQVAAIAWAYWRYGRPDDYWALVLIPLVTSAVTLIGSWIACDWRPSMPRRGAGTMPMLSFGASLTGFDFINYFARNADKALIGWRWGAEPLGLYNQAYRLFLTPLTQAVSPVASIAVPALSRLTESPERYRSAYKRIVQPLLLVLVPGVVLGLVYAEEVIALLGDKWTPAAPIFRWLLLVGLVQPFTNAVSWIMFSHGRGREILTLGTVGAIVKVLSFLVGLPWGPVGVAMSYAVSGLIVHTPMAVWYVTRVGPVSWRDLVGLFLNVIPTCAVVLVAAASAKQWLYLGNSHTALLTGMAVSGLAWVAAVAFTEAGQYTFSEMRRLVASRP